MRCFSYLLLTALQLCASFTSFTLPPFPFRHCLSCHSRSCHSRLYVKEEVKSAPAATAADAAAAADKPVVIANTPASDPTSIYKKQLFPTIETTNVRPLSKLDSETYEAKLLEYWEDPDKRKGFDWQLERLRRWAAGLEENRSKPDDKPTYYRRKDFVDWTFSPAKKTSSTTPIISLLDVVKVYTYNIASLLGLGPMLGLAAVPVAQIQKYEGTMIEFIGGVLGGDLQTLAGGPLFLLLATYYKKYGPIFNLSFGPKSFLIVNDPIMARHILRSPTESYNKGVLAEILEPIMGKGLIPADPDTWKVRRRAIVPGFHKKWLNRMVTLFASSAENLQSTMVAGSKVDMEEKFCSVTLDIIGKAVFNYDFGSVSKESPIVKAVYRTLREAEHRTTSFIPYWNLPYANQWIEGQVIFARDMELLDTTLSNLINRAILTRKEATVEELEERDNEEDPSLLRFLVDMRGEDLSSKQLRDDLMTMLIAGHETTAAVLTWTLYELYTNDQRYLEDVVSEIRSVLGNKTRPDYDDVVAMKKLRLALVEALRLYPEPPILIRRALTDDILPPGGSSLYEGIKIVKGTDIFISTWNLHRSAELWGEDSECYDPTRWERSFTNKDIVGWEGYDHTKMTEKSLYPNEIASDFAFLPFGGGQRKCIGDQFAILEATVTMAMLLNEFDFEFAGDPKDVGMRTGATIHTMNGLNMIPRRRKRGD